MKLLLLFVVIVLLMIVIAYETLPKVIVQRIANQDSNFYYGVPGLVREGMNTLRKTTMDDYPYDYATHLPTGWAKNNAISDYYNAIDFNKTIVNNNEHLIERESQISGFD